MQIAVAATKLLTTEEKEKKLARIAKELLLLVELRKCSKSAITLLKVCFHRQS